MVFSQLAKMWPPWPDYFSELASFYKNCSNDSLPLKHQTKIYGGLQLAQAVSKRKVTVNGGDN